ncbi:MAG: tRNA (N(6)-L-threonylcarbamoyladenosine(37)-C(2))-methylthiotransferase MtaB [Verrucomicrobiota bacterium]|nr:tRNA (N(6)-L-threonylcarbamoyladenosine(37)-C(2))-methylthiotransferase MtaB [Verrucomicrobiota bacterium]
MKFKVATLGCRTNQYESQGYADLLRRKGYAEAGEGDADLCIVNTCTVTEGADRSSRHQIRAFLRDHPGARIAVTGCMVESAREELLALSPRVELVPNRTKERLLEQILPEEGEWGPFQINQFDRHSRAFVKVQDGCNSFCTYCVIPYVRGRSRSRPMGEILEEVRGLVQGGYKEIVLTGINVGDFDGGGRLADLVRAVDQVEGLQRLRISSIDPDEVDGELMGAVLSGRTTCPSMHIVLQSGSNVILKRMNRKYTRQQFLEAVDRLRSARPDFTITTDVIVGFPGETEEDFQETLRLVEEIRFAKVHVFPYSARPRTRAALYPNRVPEETIARRKEELKRVAEESAYQLREQFLNITASLLLEGEDEGCLSGYTPNFLRVFLPKGIGKPGEIVEVRLAANGSEGFSGMV